MAKSQIVRQASRAVFGAPECCPYCGGHIMPMFGARIDDEGRRHAVIDPTTVQCVDCRTTFATAAQEGQ